VATSTTLPQWSPTATASTGPSTSTGEEPALVFASDGGGHLFALAGSGRVWRSTTASWFDQFDLAAVDLQEFFEGLARLISGQL
jgi:hypothetical protein